MYLSYIDVTLPPYLPPSFPPSLSEKQWKKYPGVRVNRKRKKTWSFTTDSFKIIVLGQEVQIEISLGPENCSQTENETTGISCCLNRGILAKLSGCVEAISSKELRLIAFLSLFKVFLIF